MKREMREKAMEKLNCDNGLYIGDIVKINMTPFLYMSDGENGNALTEVERSGYTA